MDYFYPHLQTGVTEPVLVTQVWDSHRLYCQLRSMSHEVQRLSESMHHYYEVQKGCGDLGQQPSLVLGQPCASRGTDGRWYRSLLQEYFPDKHLATVVHVDWGRREIVSLSGLRNLASEFFRMPVVTYPCTMYGISSGILGWDSAMLTEIRSLLLGRHVSAKIECYNSYERLYVVTLFAEDGVNLNNFLSLQSQRVQVCPGKMPSATEPPPLTEDNVTEDSPYSSKFPPVELEIGKFKDAVVEYVIDPSNFWIRLEKYAENFKEMVEGITTKYTKASKLDGIIAYPNAGQLCCAKYQDMYYRAEIISVIHKKVNVYFLDNGITETVDWTEVKELPVQFSKLPGLANKCCLAETYPLGEAWSQEAILAFKVAVIDKKFIIHVVSKDGDEYTIELIDESRFEEKNVGKILAKVGLASFEELDSVNRPTSGEKMAHDESARAALNPAAPDYVSKVQESDASAIYEENMEDSPFEDQLFEPGTTIEIMVSHVEHPGLFWCQNASYKADLNSLMGAIQDHCMSTDCPYSAETLACLARSPSDGIWRRAFITESPVNMSKTSVVKVLYVDYGKQETVSVTNLRALSSEFFYLKSQAFKCSLYNIITPVEGSPFLWDNNASEVFKQFVQGASKWTEFHCIVYATASLNKELFNIVDLYTPFESVCDTLVRSSYAAHLHHKSLTPSVQLTSFYYSKHDIKMGNDEEIYVMHVVSPSSFYGHLARAFGTLDQISLKITKAVKKAQKIKSTPISGTLCLAKFVDQQWYRGLIVYENGIKKIFFVDYGNTETLPEEDLLPIMPSENDLLFTPMQAIKFSLSDTPSKLPDEIVSWFENVVLDTKLRAQIVEKDAGGKLSVELYDGKLQINAALKSKLGLSVPKAKLDRGAGDQSKTFKQDDSRKLPSNTSHQERMTSFSVGKNVKSRDSDIRDHSDMGQEPEPRSRKNPTFPYKAEKRDHNSQFQDFSSQKKTETVQRGSYQESHGGRDTKQGGNKTLPERQSCTLAVDAKRQSPAKAPVATLSDIPKRTILPGMKEPVYISQTNSVFDFYLQVAEDSQLDEMSDILNNEKSSFEDLGVDDIRVGNVICVPFPDDGLYYRGLVTRKSRQGLCVEYIDYGNTSALSDCKSYRLPQKCLSVPVMSIHCSLAKPRNALTSPDLRELLAEFSKRVCDIQLDCEFVTQDGPKWDVILKDELGCINDLLTASEEPVPEKNIAEVSEMVMKMNITKEETSVKTFTWNLPQPGATVKVFASAADSPDCFWCQLSTADIDSLASQVQEAGEQSIKSDDFIDSLKIGSPCNVVFSEDDNWYRAIVTRLEAGLVTVRFIDYGNEDSVGRDQIKQLPDSLIQIPPQAFPCCLADFDMKAGTWSPEAKNYFYEKVTEDMLELTVCTIEESDSCHIPVASVTVKCNQLEVNEEMRRFGEKVQCTDQELPHEPTNFSPKEIMEEDQSHSYIDAPTADPGSNLGERAQYEEGVEDTVDLHHTVHVDLAGEDSDHAALIDHAPEDMDELGLPFRRRIASPLDAVELQSHMGMGFSSGLFLVYYQYTVDLHHTVHVDLAGEDSDHAALIDHAPEDMDELGNV
ncbi:tudor domain-containing protein 6 [Bufo gargarizans]|uniref:tudor domain-containing protein 6 n=1 Tax=Bufo gargarizans TaxID=30331 RepID=UPI001CF25492|nr:tudor domain-containing protein 6 [Bufo gargarizans]